MKEPDRFKEAVERYRNEIPEKGGDVRVVLHRALRTGLGARRRGESADAIRDLEWACELSPTDERYWYDLGSLVRDLKQDKVRVEQAIAAFRRASELAGLDTQRGRSYRTSEIDILFDSGRVDEARQALEDLVKIVPKEPDGADIFGYLGYAWLKLEQYPQAFEVSRKAVDREPKNAVYQYNLGRAQEEIGKTNAGPGQLEAALVLQEGGRACRRRPERGRAPPDKRYLATLGWLGAGDALIALGRAESASTPSGKRPGLNPGTRPHGKGWPGVRISRQIPGRGRRVREGHRG